jgi:HAE1 family hydrophobic/amphiphilic exporter-1
MEAGYPHLLRWSLRHRAAVLVLVLAALGGTLTLIPRLGRELVPPFAQGEFTFNVKLPEGSPLSRTDAVVSRMEEDLEQDPRVETYFANIGTSERSGSAALDKEEHRAQVHVVLEHQLSLKGEDRVVESLRRRFAEIPGMEFDFERPSTFTFTTPIEVEIYGHDLVELREAAARVTRRLERVDGLRDVHSSVVEGNPEIRIVFDRDRIARLGLDLGTISETLRNKVRGDVATRFREYDRQIDIRVRSYDPATSRLRDVENLVVGHVDGIPITLPNVAEIQAERGPSQIERRSQQRAAVVSANIAGRDLGSVSREIEAALREVPLPATFSAVLSGQNKELQSSFSGLFFAIALAVFLVYLVMASQFESLVHPFLIMFTVPLALIGVLVTLALAGQRLSVVVLLGCIVLAGIVVNNGIVLIDYINQLRRRGMPRDEAITTAGHTRLRPIVMTTLTTVLALLPMAMGLGEGAEIRTPMAFTVIGGLLVSTLLTLVVIPVLYSLVDRRP